MPIPEKPNRLSRDLKAPIALNPVLRPIAISAIISAKPKVTAKNQINQKKCTTSILGRKVRESPDISQAYR